MASAGLLLLTLFAALGGRVAAQSDDANNDAAITAARDQAVAATLAADAFQFGFTLDLTLESELNLSMALEGAGGWVRAAGTSGTNAFALQFSGDVSAQNAEQDDAFPVTGEVRWLNDTLYTNLTRTDTGETTGWQDDTATELAGGFVNGLNTGGLNVDADALASGDLAANPSVAPFIDLLTALDPADFITLERDPQGATGDTFITTLSVADLLGTSAIEDLITTALETSGADATTLGQVGFIAQVLSNAVGDSRFELQQTHDPATGAITGANLTGNFELDPRMIGQQTAMIALNVEGAVQLFGIGEPYTVEAPENFESDEPLVSADETIASTADATTAAQPATTTATATPPPTMVAAPGAPVATFTPAAGETMFITTVGKLFPNTPREIELAGNGPVDLLYQASAGEVLTVTARSLETSDSLDLTLNLLNATGGVIAFNDDHDGDDPILGRLDSQVSSVTIAEAGEIVIRVHTFDPRQAGQVEVTLQTSLVPTPTPTNAPIVEQPDGTRILSGDVPLNGAYTLPFSGQAGSIVTFTVRSRDNSLDPKATLLDADGETLIENDDHDSDDPTLDSYDSQIADYTLPATGDYSLVITGFSGSGGQFELAISGEGVGGIQIASLPEDDPTPDREPTAEPTREPTPRPTQGASVPAPEREIVGQANDQLRRGQTLDYTFDAQAGEIYTFSARSDSDATDLLLTLYNEDGDYVADNDNHGSDNPALAFRDSQLYNVVIEEDGEYTLRVSDYNEAGAEVEVIMEQILLDAPLTVEEEPVITGEIESGGLEEHTVELQAGDLVTISVSRLTGDLDPLVALFSPDGDLLIQNDDFGAQGGNFGYLNSRINNFFIAESGTYTMEVSGYQETRGSYALVISIRR